MTFKFNWPLAFPEFCWTWTAVRDKTFSLYDSAGMTRFVCNVYNCNTIPTDVIDQPRCYNCEHFCNLYVMINEILLAIIIVTKFGFKICIQITWHPSSPSPSLPPECHSTFDLTQMQLCKWHTQPPPSINDPPLPFSHSTHYLISLCLSASFIKKYASLGVLPCLYLDLFQKVTIT